MYIEELNRSLILSDFVVLGTILLDNRTWCDIDHWANLSIFSVEPSLTTSGAFHANYISDKHNFLNVKF